MTLNRFARYAWAVLAFNVLVILWGAVVSATGSGAGCGEHWPLCDGEVIPRAPSVERMIEFSHRATSGLALLLVVGLAVWAWRAYPAGSAVRRGAVASLVVIIIESLLGASLVLFGWTALDTSLIRVLVQPLHMLNTLLLLAAILLTAWWASGGEPIQLAGQGARLTWLALGLAAVGLMSATGSVISLGDLLAIRLGERYNTLVEALVQLRLGHPGVAILAGLYLVWMALSRPEVAPTPLAQRLAYFTIGMVIAQWAVGFLNVWLGVPLWTQILHLLLADLTWMTLVLWTAAALARSAAPVAAPNTLVSRGAAAD